MREAASQIAAVAAALITVLWPVLPALEASEQVTIRFEEWDVPGGAATFPHDPAFAPDGGGWFTAYRGNTLGRVDPRTGQFRQFRLPTNDTGPHGLVADTSGNIWYTGYDAALIGKLDPTTGNVTEYKMPDPAARGPHTPIFDRRGILWFTVQTGNFVGKLDPASGVIALRQPSTPQALPHGIAINAQDIPFFAMFGTNKIGRIDPKTMEITEYVLPEGARPRRIAVTPDDAIWYVDHARGALSRLDPKTGVVKEFRSPGGPESAPTSIAVTSDGIIWYSESGVKPNTLVRFDPKDGTTKSWPIPSGGGIVRHMVAAPDGTLWLVCSGSGKIARVQIIRS